MVTIAVAVGLGIHAPFIAPGANAAEVKLLSAAVMKPALIELAGEFERTTGHTLAITYDSAGAVTKRIQGGETADVAIIQRPSLEALVQQGKVVAGTIMTVARSGVAVAVQRAARNPTSARSMP